MTLASILLLVGCGTQVALSGRAYDDYQKSIKPYIVYWEKARMTESERRQDWVMCGVVREVHFHGKSNNSYLMSPMRLPVYEKSMHSSDA